MSESYDEPATTKGNNKSYVANPRAPKGEEYSESTGPITSDSLARESINSGGGFSANANPEVYDVAGANSTFTNTDTSNADTLDPADNREDRDGDRFTSERYPSGQTSSEERSRYDDSTISTSRNQGYQGGNTSSSYNNEDDNDTAPTYTTSTTGTAFSSGTYQPKGENLNENDSSIPPNRSTYTGDVGGSKDPGRLAEAKFARENATAGGDAGLERDRGDVDGGTRYDALGGSERA